MRQETIRRACAFFFAALAVFLYGCGARSDAPGGGGTMLESATPCLAGSDGGAAAVPATSRSPSCLSTMASFTKGLLDDLSASIGPEWRDRNNDPAVDGVSMTRGYGVDLAMLTTEFSVNRE